MRVLHKALTVAVGSLQKYELRGFLIKIRELIEWKSVPLMVCYCCDIPKANDNSAISQSFLKREPRVICMVTGEDIFNGEMASE